MQQTNARPLTELIGDKGVSAITSTMKRSPSREKVECSIRGGIPLRETVHHRLHW